MARTRLKHPYSHVLADVQAVDQESSIDVVTAGRCGSLTLFDSYICLPGDDLSLGNAVALVAVLHSR